MFIDKTYINYINAALSELKERLRMAGSYPWREAIHARGDNAEKSLIEEACDVETGLVSN